MTLEDRNPRLRHVAPVWWSGIRRLPRVHGFGVPSQSTASASAAARLAELGLLALATPWLCGVAGRFFVRGWASVLNRHLNMFTLIALGVGAAYATALWRRSLPASSRTVANDGEVAVYFEPAAVIVVLVRLGQVLELRPAAEPVRRFEISSDSRRRRRARLNLTWRA